MRRARHVVLMGLLLAWPLVRPALPLARGSQPPAIAVLQAWRDGHVIPSLRDLRNTRWVSLHHVAPERLDIETRLLFACVNSLSTRKAISIPWAVPDTGGRLFRIDLRSYDWRAADWERMGAAQPYFRDATLQPALDSFAWLKSVTGSGFPVARGDYLAYRGTLEDDPATDKIEGFYETFLRLGDTEAEFHTKFGVDLLAVRRSGSYEGGVVVRTGGPTNFNRRLARVPTTSARDGFLWISYDTLGNFDDKNALERLFGDLNHFATEQIAKLPNGGQAYGLFAKDGKRLAFGDPRIAHDKHFRDSMVWTGRSCIGCHAEGIRPFENVIAKLAQTGRFDVRFRDENKLRAALDFYATDLDSTIASDQASYQRFMDATTGLKSAEFAREYIAGFARYYDGLIDLETAARELGLTVEECRGLLAASGDAALVALGAGQGMPRDAWEGEGDQSAFGEALKLKLLLDAKNQYIRRLREPVGEPVLEATGEDAVNQQHP